MDRGAENDERALVDRLLAGEGDAVATVQGWIAKASSSFRRRLSGEWEDLQQQLMLEVLEDLRAGRWEGSGPFGGFVRRTVVHSCIDRIRYHQRWRFISADSLCLRGGRQRDRTGYLTTLSIAQQMPEDCQRMWRMILEGMSYSEMSAQLGVREGTLRARVLRCRERARALRDELASEPEGPKESEDRQREARA